jgi:hypothetical protein
MSNIDMNGTFDMNDTFLKKVIRLIWPYQKRITILKLNCLHIMFPPIPSPPRTPLSKNIYIMDDKYIGLRGESMNKVRTLTPASALLLTDKTQDSLAIGSRLPRRLPQEGI